MTNRSMRPNSTLLHLLVELFPLTISLIFSFFSLAILSWKLLLWIFRGLRWGYPLSLHLKWRSATRDFIFMFWIIANDCACLMNYLFWESLVNKLNYGVGLLHQLPATSGHIKFKQQTFTLIFPFSSSLLIYFPKFHYDIHL